VHGGTQSLKLYYDNDGTNFLGTSGKKYYSELTADTSHLPIGGPNWTEHGTKALTLWFYGDPDNDADTTEQMYVKLNGEKIDYDGDMNDIRQASWHEWNIDLAQFGIDLSNVTEIAIGFGNETNTTTPGGSGIVHFDDIRLCWPECRPELLALAGDFDGDCLVGYADLAVLASDWLAAEETIVFAANQMQEPATPVLWYKFDETTGIAVTDHAGFYDGTVVNLGDDTWDTSGGRDGNGCINLAAGSQTFVEIPTVALNFASTTQRISFAAWVNADRGDPQDSWDGLFGVRAADADPVEDGSEVVEVHCPTPLPPTYDLGPRVEWRVAGSLWCQSDTLHITDFAGRWNHYVFTKDASSDIMRIYHNGRLEVEVVDADSAADPMFETPVGWFAVGARHIYWGYYIGKIDDFQVYDYALSPEEVAWLATDGTGSLYVPLERSTNLYDVPPDVIDFKDLVVLADNWLEELLWP